MTKGQKIYIVSCDDKDVYDKFIEIIAPKVVKFSKLDYNSLKLKNLNKISKLNLSRFSNKDMVFCNKITDILNGYNNCLYNTLLEVIDEAIEYNTKFIFIRVDNLTIINKLKRRYKKPNYKTIRIDNTKILNNRKAIRYNEYNFDGRIDYVDNRHLRKQAISFISKHVGSIEYLRK